MFSLAFYKLRVRDRSTNEYQKLDQLPVRLDLYSILYDAFSECRERTMHLYEEKHMRVSECKKISPEMFAGLIETGVTGFESKIAEVVKNSDGTNGAKDVFRRQVNQAEMLPYYFLVTIPKGGTEALIVLQRFKQYGVKEFFLGFARGAVSRKLDFFDVEMKKVMPKKAFEKIANTGGIKAIRFIRKNCSDVADAVRYGSHKIAESAGEVELIVKAPRKGFLSDARDLMFSALSKSNNTSNFIEMDDFEFDVIKIDVVVDKKKKVVNLSSARNTIGNIDVSDDVVTGTNGHPTWDSIHNLAVGLVNGLTFLE